MVTLPHMTDHALHLSRPLHLPQAVHCTLHVLLLPAAYHHISTITNQPLGNAKPYPSKKNVRAEISNKISV